LWYWTGQINSSGTVEWMRHGRYGTGQLPSITLNNQGWFVEVHQSENNDTVWSHVGFLNNDYEATFYNSIEFDDGQAPSVAFIDLNGTALREIHNSASTGLNWDWYMTLDTSSSNLIWGSHSQTSDSKFLKSMASSTANTIEVWTGSDLSAPNDTLLYASNQVSRRRIRYSQLAHVELQNGDSIELQDTETTFAAVGSGNASTIYLWNTQGYFCRMWGFQSQDVGQSLPMYPATDAPFALWYENYLLSVNAIN
jgi:hypothetical protein